MARIGGRLAMRGLGVTIDAGSIRIVRRINVAVRAHSAVVRQPPESVVIECSAQPTRRIVAAGGRTIRREAGSDVVRNPAAERDGALPGRDVTTVAIHGQVAGIVVVHVARGTRSLRWIRVRSR